MASINLFIPTAFMNCHSALYCGILTLERGGGSGMYHHKIPQVHGLWPENGRFGNSHCVYPHGNKRASLPKVPCYHDKNLQRHEWIKPGTCASSTPEEYFTSICNLSKEPLCNATTT